MILPAKHLRQDRALIGIGSEILNVLDQGHSVSELWQRVRLQRSDRSDSLSYDWFILGLSFLFAINAVRFDRGILTKGGGK